MTPEELIAVMLDAFRRDVMNAFASVRQDEARAREEAVREAEARGRAAGLEEAARLCAAADKSAHPADLADSIRAAAAVTSALPT